MALLRPKRPIHAELYYLVEKKKDLTRTSGSDRALLGHTLVWQIWPKAQKA